MEDQRLGAGRGARAGERTENMPCMFVTRDVSKLTGWLKASVDCRVEGRACDLGARCANRKARELGRGAAVGRKWRPRGEDPTGGLWGQGMRGRAHGEHAAHVRDAGCVEAHRLVEGRRELPSRKQGVRCRARCGTGDRKAWG